LLGDDSAATPSPYESLEKKVNNIQSDMVAMKSEVKSEFAVLTEKINSLDTHITTQIKRLSETVSAQISVLNANLQSMDAHMESRLDKLENRMTFGMLFAVSGPRICYILLSNNCEGT
jgi:chromosome segregation ATPase